jgi:hypothetical protein
VLAAGCGSSKSRASDGTDGSGGTVSVSGQVARSCVGPIVVGQPRRCSERAVFALAGERVTVRGKFTVKLRRGTYRVSVDTCTDQETVTVTHAISGLSLVPRCALPL